jgi:hypothetical protein
VTQEPSDAVSEQREVPRPVLSLLVCSRNDDYLGSALWRLQTGLNLTARAVHELGLQDSVEILLSDWGSETPLREALALTPEAASLVRFVEVPKPLAAMYQRDAPFSEVHALNAAARRSRGEYIGRIDQDTILGRGFLQRFFEMHRGERETDVPLRRALMLSNRRGVPYRLASQCPPAGVIGRFVRTFGGRLPLANPLPDDRYYQSYVGIWMIHRDLWFEVGGYDESFIYINWMEVDMILRLESKGYEFVNLGRLIDHDIYHLDHIHPLAHWGAKGRVRRENPYRDRANPPTRAFPNSENWGLANEDVPVVPFESRLELAETAVQATRHPRWGSYMSSVGVLAARNASDRVLLGLLAVAMAGPRLLLSLSPQLRESASGYRDALRGRSVLQWPRLAREHWTDRRRRRSVETGRRDID